MTDDDARILDFTRPPGRGGKGQSKDFATKEDVIAAMGAGSLAIGQKVYEQIAAETARMLEEMEARLRAELTLTGRIRTLLARLRR